MISPPFNQPFLYLSLSNGFNTLIATAEAWPQYNDGFPYHADLYTGFVRFERKPCGDEMLDAIDKGRIFG